MVVETMHPSGEKIKLVGSPIKMPHGGDEEFTHPPALGEHTEKVLTKLLNLSPSEIQQLRDKKVIGSPPKSLHDSPGKPT